MSGPVAFLERQFRRQVASHEFALNPFEEAALPYLKGRVLDLVCGLRMVISTVIARKATPRLQ